MVVLGTDDLFELAMVEEYSAAAATLLEVDPASGHGVHNVLALWANHRNTLPVGPHPAVAPQYVRLKCRSDPA